MSAPVVLLHGFTGSPSSFDALARHLPDDAPLFRPALLGHAGGPLSGEGWDEEIGRLTGLIRREVGEGVHLVGYSLGARIALSILASAPELASRATLNGARLPPASPAERRARADRDEALARRLELEPLETFVRAWEALPLFETQRALPREVRERRRRERLMHDPEGLAVSLRVLGLAQMPDLRLELGGVLTPITLAVGSLDSAFSAHAEELLAHLPRARRVLFEGAGHDLTLERPAELAASIMEER